MTMSKTVMLPLAASTKSPRTDQAISDASSFASGRASFGKKLPTRDRCITSITPVSTSRNFHVALSCANWFI